MFNPKSRGMNLDIRPQAFGMLKSSNDISSDSNLLNQRLNEEGYLYLPNFFNREDVLSARKYVLEILKSQGILKEGSDLMDGVAKEDVIMGFKPELAKNNKALHKYLYSGKIIEFYSTLFGEGVRYLDYTWFRAVAHNLGVKPHSDLVYMGRGERKRLMTAWIPVGDITMDIGGLMILEKSHHKQDKLKAYLERDVDTYCSNGPNVKDIISGKKQWEWSGELSSNPVELQKELGGRWLTASFKAGDLLTFNMQIVHASLDNVTNYIRLSSDSRYQPISSPVDERWVGPNPIGHTAAGKRGRIC